MPRRVRFLLFSVVAIPLFVVITSFFSDSHAVNLARTFFNGESAVGFWMKDGLSFSVAVAIAIACSTWDTICWYCLFSCFEWIYSRTKSLCQKLESWIAAPDKKDLYIRGILIATIHPTPFYKLAVSKAYSFAKRSYSFFAPEKIFAALYPDADKETSPRRRAFVYFLLLPFGFVPGCIFNGIYCIIRYKLNRFVALPLLFVGNAGKMFASGYMAMKIGPWGVVGVVIGFWVMENSGRLRTLAGRFFRSLTART